MKTSRILKITCLLWIAGLTLVSCTASRKPFDPDKKYSPEALRSDYRIFRGILQSAHPSLYWYTTKDSMNYFFNEGDSALRDSMTEPQFRTDLSYVIAKIDCGHTSIKTSKAYSRYLDTATESTFPFALKFWSDSMVITANLWRRDPIFRRGTVLKSINGYDARQLTDTLFNYVTTDGYSACGKFQTLSTGFTFAHLYKEVLGEKGSFDVRYIDSLGVERQAFVPLYNFKADTLNRIHSGLDPGNKKREKKQPSLEYFSSVNLQLDTVMKTAFMSVATFDRSNHLRKFFRNSFREIRRDHISDLVIDVRSNGGGDAGISTLLTRYLIDRKFRLADSLYTVKAPREYNKYIGKDFWYNLLTRFVTRREPDGKYHFRYFERHEFSPREKDHFNGQVYILIGGNSFSATTLFVGAIKGQKNVTVVGEETGGGHYGNSAWIIQDVTLPNTGVRFRLPRFRMVIDKNREKDGRGIMPDVWATPSARAIQLGIDFKSMKVRELIDQRKSQNR
ncbi:MAG: S41 family peptidase [Bacteroidota bacterium]|nr:S41 family peptidase [Bacteroidota bacterium]MDP4212272.1 S41 family peptidase [Bacteroidota bacterium]MDP4248879.1 S41 family peptidase [Bacteroidota bacterium]